MAVLHTTDKVPRHSNTSLKMLTQWQPLSAQPDNRVSLLLLQEAWGEGCHLGATQRRVTWDSPFSRHNFCISKTKTPTSSTPSPPPAPFHRSSKSGQDLKRNPNFISLTKHTWSSKYMVLELPSRATNGWVSTQASGKKKKLPQPAPCTEMFTIPPYTSPVMKQAAPRGGEEWTALKSSQCHAATGGPDGSERPQRPHQPLRGQQGLRRQGAHGEEGYWASQNESELLSWDCWEYAGPPNSSTCQHSEGSQQPISYLHPTG